VSPEPQAAESAQPSEPVAAHLQAFHHSVLQQALADAGAPEPEAQVRAEPAVPSEEDSE